MVLLAHANRSAFVEHLAMSLERVSPSGGVAMPARDVAPPNGSTTGKASQQGVTHASKGRTAVFLVWALVPLFTIGMLSAATFSYAAIRLRSRSLGIWAAIYGVATAIFLFLTNSAPQDSPVNNLGVVIGISCTAVATGHALAIRQRVQRGPYETAEVLAKERIQRRERCRRLLISNPSLAEELRIGRPDLGRDYDDGGLVDVNHVPQQFLTSLPGIDRDLATQIADMRESIGGFDSLDDMEVLLGVPPQRLDAAKDYVVFVR